MAQPCRVFLVNATWWLRVPARRTSVLGLLQSGEAQVYISQESSLISSPSLGGEEIWSLLLKLDLGRINYT